MRASSVARSSASRTIPELFKANTQLYEHKDLLRYCEFEEIRWTYKEVERHVRALGAGLVGHRVRAGDTMLSVLGNESETSISFLAAAHVRAPVLFLPVNASAADLDAALLASEARGAFLRGRDEEDGTDGASVWYELEPRLERWPYGKPLKFHRYPKLKALLHSFQYALPGMVQIAASFVGSPMPDPLIKLEAGTTASHVAASSFEGGRLRSFTHGGMVEAAQQFADGVGLDSTDRVQMDAPANSPTGQAVGLLACVSHAATLISTSQDFNAESSASGVDQEEPTVIIGTPETFAEAARVPAQHAGTVERLVILSDDARPRTDLNALKQVYPSLKSVQVALTHPGVVGAQYISDNVLDAKSPQAILQDVGARGDTLGDAPKEAAKSVKLA